MKKMLILIVILGLCGCDDAPAAETIKCKYLGQYIHKCDLGDVICYKYASGHKGGLSCIKKDVK